MPWICTSCSKRFDDGLQVLGFGLCKTCRDKKKIQKSKERAAMLAARKKKYAKLAKIVKTKKKVVKKPAKKIRKISAKKTKKKK